MNFVILINEHFASLWKIVVKHEQQKGVFTAISLGQQI